MKPMTDEYPFRSRFSLAPLVDFHRASRDYLSGDCSGLPQDLEEGLARAPELLEPMDDTSRLISHEGLVRRLMGVVFPEALWETEGMAAAFPLGMKPAWSSPTFQRLLIGERGNLKGRPLLDPEEDLLAHVMSAYYLILERLYGIAEGFEMPLTQVVPDPDTGLDRYIRLKRRFGFVDVCRAGGPERLGEREMAVILDNLNDPPALRKILPPQSFEFTGFTVLFAVDMTEVAVISALERDLIDNVGIASHEGFSRLQERLRTLFNRPDLTAGLTAVREDQAFLLSSGYEMKANCIFGSSRRVSTSQFVGSVYHRAIEKGGITRIRDLAAIPNRTAPDEETLEHGSRSLLIAPLFFGGRLIGALKLGAPEPDAFGPTDELIAKELLPMFSLALQRSLEKLDSDIEAVIKQRCTAVHPSVEWKFRRGAVEHLESVHRGEPQEMRPIVFRDVYSLYGAADIRGSSDTRNACIKEDLTEQLTLAKDVIETALDTRDLPALEELSFRIEEHVGALRDGVSTGDEMTVSSFLQKEVEPAFKPLRVFGPRVTDSIAAYERSMDSERRTVYRKRKAFDEAVAIFNERLSTYIEREQAQAQAIFPHYFDKRQTDGIGYVIYAGASMSETGDFDHLYLRNLRTWQIVVACGMALLTDQLNRILDVPLESTHLILVNHNPLAIRFRFDEKRFDVDGSYNIGHEIIRSRIDKAMVKGGSERLTQPEKIAIVYSRPAEAREMELHVRFLQAQGFLLDETEYLDLDDLPGVKGLKALRVGVNLESSALTERVRRITAESGMPERMAS